MLAVSEISTPKEIALVSFKSEHLKRLQLQPAQAYLKGIISDEDAQALESKGVQAFSMLDGETVLACGGLLPVWHGRAIAWMMIGGEAQGARFLTVHKAVKRFLDTCYISRIEATVDCGFEAGHRWMDLLGFKLEAERMRGYNPIGGDCALYARVSSKTTWH